MVLIAFSEGGSCVPFFELEKKEGSEGGREEGRKEGGRKGGREEGRKKRGKVGGNY
jgi:hypothetical protein